MVTKVTMLTAVDLELAHLAGLPPIRLHDLRDTLGTLQRRAGADLKRVPELLGHLSVQVTADVYVGGVPEALREAVARYERMLTAPAPKAADD